MQINALSICFLPLPLPRLLLPSPLWWAIAQRWLGNSAAILLAGLAGFADSHSAAASVAALESSSALSLSAAQLAVLLILSTNTLTKLVLAWSLGSKGYAGWLTLGLVLSLAAAWLGMLIHL